MRRFLAKMKTKKSKIIKVSNKPFVPAHWRGKSIGLPCRYCPGEDPSSYNFKHIEVSTECEVYEAIDRADYSLTELREICEYNDFPFYWLTGLDHHNFDLSLISSTMPLEKALDYFMALFTSGSSTAQYRRIFQDLIDSGITHKAMTLEEFKDKEAEIRKKILNLNPKDEKAKSYTYVDKILFILDSFINFCSGSKKKLFVNKYEDCDRRRKRSKNSKALSEEDKNKILENLSRANSVYALIVKIFIYLNGPDLFGDEDGTPVPLECILKLKKTDILQESYNINLTKKVNNHPYFIWTYIPEDLFEGLEKLSHKTNLFVFQNKKRGQIASTQIRSLFRKISRDTLGHSIDLTSFC